MCVDRNCGGLQSAGGLHSINHVSIASKGCINKSVKTTRGVEGIPLSEESPTRSGTESDVRVAGRLGESMSRSSD